MLFSKLSPMKIALCGALVASTVSAVLSAEASVRYGKGRYAYRPRPSKPGKRPSAPTTTDSPKVTSAVTSKPGTDAQVTLSRDLEKKTLLPNKFTADPSAHVIGGKLYVFASTDRPEENFEDPNEMHFLMT